LFPANAVGSPHISNRKDIHYAPLPGKLPLSVLQPLPRLTARQIRENQSPDALLSPVNQRAKGLLKHTNLGWERKELK